MNVLWLVPRVHSFIRDELVALAPHVSNLHVLCRDPCGPISGVHVAQVERRDGSKGLESAVTRIHAAIGCPEADIAPAHAELIRTLASWSLHIGSIARAHEIEVIHSHFAFPFGSAGLFAANGRPIVVTLRGTDILTLPGIGYGHTLDPLFRRLLQLALQEAESVTVASATTAFAVRDLMGSGFQPTLVPNGVDLTRFRPDPEAGPSWRARLGIGPDAAVILAAGTLTARKRVRLLIEAMASVRERVPDAHLVIAGDGPQMAELEEFARRIGVGERVRMIGRVDHAIMPSLMSASTLLAHTPEVEGFGNVVLEALACGTPVVATATGFAAEALADGSCGSLIAPEPASVADAIVRLLCDGALRARLGANAVRCASGYSMERRVASILSLYRPCTRDGGELLLQGVGPQVTIGSGPLVALIGSESGASVLSESASVCRLLPHDADIAPSRFPRCPDLLVIQASAGDSAGPWRHLGSMYAHDRASHMLRLVRSARAREVPVVLWRDAPMRNVIWAVEGIGRVLDHAGPHINAAEALAAVRAGGIA